MFDVGKLIKIGRRQVGVLKNKLAGSKNPLFCLFAVTNNCNSRCIMCNFWKNKSTNELTLNEIEKLFSSKVLKNLVSIGITGGEPLVRPDIKEIIQIIYDATRVKPAISTNGFAPLKLKEVLEAKHKFIDSVGFSVDGLKETHEKVRGIKNGFEKVNKSIQIAKDFGLRVSVNITLFHANYKDLYETWLQYKDENFSYKLAQTSNFYYGDNTNINLDMNDKIKSEILVQMERIVNNNPLSKNNLYNVFLEDWIRSGKRPHPCYAGLYDIYIDAWGNIFPCIHKLKFGNIREEPLEKIWYSKNAEALRKIYKICQDCYERCTTSTFEVDALRWQFKRLLMKYGKNSRLAR